MKKNIIAIAAIAAAFSMVSCSREQLVEPEVTPVVGNDIITAFTESTLTKTSLDGDDTEGYDVVWSEGDQIKIGGNTFTLTEGATTTSGKFQGTLPTEDGEYTACYPATYNGTDWPIEQTYAEGNITGSPMTADVTVSGGKVLEKSLSFKNAGGILRLTLKGTAQIRSIKVSADDLDEITLDCRSGVSLDADGTAFHIAMPEGKYSGVSISIWTIGFDNCTKKLKTDTKLIIEPSKITTASFTADFPAPAPTDPLSGKFTVNSYGKQICFSRGNLRYTVASGEWSFFDKQYKCGPLNSVDKNEISLFTWGYNATESIKPAGNSSNNVSVTSGDLSQAQDWGSVIGDGKTWRTLTSAEWTYLFEGRIDADKKCGYGTLGNVTGLIILPDEFTDPMKNSGSGAFKPQSSTASSWTDNVYTLAGNWEAMEAAGAVFLPITGRRSGESIAMGNMGFYWSSSANDTSDAYHIYFGGYNYVLSAGNCSRGLSCAVRLVTDISSSKGYAVATIDGKATHVNWVQLWKNGPKFAEYNVGATSITGYGGYYLWGNAIDKDINYWNGAELGEHDTATLLWGSNWRIPTKTELEALLSNCNTEWTTVGGVNGRKFTGKGDYSDNSIFLPAAGSYQKDVYYYLIYSTSNSGYYWTSTPQSSENYGYKLYFDSNRAETSGAGRDCGNSVRAVLAE